MLRAVATSPQSSAASASATLCRFVVQLVQSTPDWVVLAGVAPFAGASKSVDFKSESGFDGVWLVPDCRHGQHRALRLDYRRGELGC